MSKTLAQMLKNNNAIHSCDPEKVILIIVENGFPIKLNQPTKSKDLKCNMCGNTDGGFNPVWNAWFCKSKPCIERNARKSDFVPPKPEDYIPKVPACNQIQDVLDYFIQYCKNPIGFVLLTGANGTGKTYLASAVFDDLRRFSYERKFVNVVGELKDEWLQHVVDYKYATHLVQKYVDYKFIVLDELMVGKEPSPAFLDFLYAIVDKRYNANKATIITTNLNSDQMRETFGDAFVSRIGGGKIIKFHGEDRRRIEF